MADEQPYSLKDLVRNTAQVTGYADKEIGPLTIPGGPIPGLLTTAGLGLGGGWLGSKIYNMIRGGEDEAKKKRTRNWMILGALGAGIPAAAHSYSLGREALAEDPTATVGEDAMKLLHWPGDGGSQMKAAVKKAVELHDTPQSTSSKLRSLFFDDDDDETEARNKRTKDWLAKALEDSGATVDVGGSEKAAYAPVQQSMALVAADPYMSPTHKALAMNVLLQANNNQPRGIVSVGDIFRGAIGAGLGLGAGVGVAKAMDGIFGLPTPIKKLLSYTGAIGGSLVGAGLTR